MASSAADRPQDGIVRSSSGNHQTYAPDGMLDFNFGNTAPAAAIEDPRASTAPSLSPEERRALRQSHVSSASTLANSPLRPEDQSENEKKSDDDMNIRRSSSEQKAAVDARANSNEGSSSDEQPDLEKQQSKDEKEANNEGEDDKDPNLIEWDGDDDPENPMNWPSSKKWIATVTLGLMTFSVTFASSVFSAATRPTAMLFGVSTEVMVLGTSLFVLGFAFGPIVWGPFSELFGRKIPLFIGFACFVIFAVPVAVAQNIYTVMICRFFGGFFASAPLAIVGGTLADFFGPVDRGVAITVFAGATFMGPVMGPIIGGFVTMNVGWRWTQWVQMLMAATFMIIGWFTYQESFAPVLLQRRAKKIRYETRNWAIHAPADEKKVDPKELAEKYLLRPFIMLFREPILILITLYMSLIYGILYLFFEVYPITFQMQRGWNPGVGALPFLAILIGVLCGAIFISTFTKTRFKHRLQDEGHVVPEERLIPMAVGGFLLPAGLFWFAWTSSPNITPWPQIIAGAPIGMGIMMIFMQGLNYIIDVYTINANSAIASNTFARSWCGAGFPMFAMGMFHDLGVPWATSLLGFLTAAMFPVPILFYIYGERIRKLSKYTPQ